MTAPEVKTVLDKILASSEFKDSKRYQDLLRYLVEESIKGNSVKETTIAHDIFGKDSKFDPSEDPSIRVYVSNLRKKLEHYYLTTEDNCPVRLEIPKGQYTVQFSENRVENKHKVPTRKFAWYWIVIGFLSIVIIIQFALYFFNNGNNSTTEGNFVWAEFLTSNTKPTMVVLGDYLFLFEKNQSESGGLFVRDPRINTEEEYRNVLKQNPEFVKQFVVLNFTFLRPSATWALSEILPFLWNSPNKVFLKLASQVKWEDFQTHNVVFIGSFKTLYKMKQLLTTFNVKYNSFPPSIEIVDKSNKLIQKFSPTDLSGGNYQKDYGVIVKQRGPNGNTMLFLLGFDEVGVVEAAKTSVDKNLKGLIEMFSKKSVSVNNFEMVIEAEGVDQTSFNSSVKFFRELIP